MSNLNEFAKRVQDNLSAANRQPHWELAEAQRYMAAVGLRRERFNELAIRLAEAVIRPRFEVVASYFPNVNRVRNEPVGCCSYWFGYCQRFPASAKVAIAVQHDVRFENLVVCYEASMLPVFIKLDERDKMTLLLSEASDDVIANWIEKRLLEFLDAYLRIDCGDALLAVATVIDPVCGMRISRSAAAASDTHLGHPYFFCSLECQERFSAAPREFVDVKTM